MLIGADMGVELSQLSWPPRAHHLCAAVRNKGVRLNLGFGLLFIGPKGWI